MTAQLQLNLLEWIDAGDAVLRNVGTFGAAYNHSKVERFQKATNAVAGVFANGPSNPAIPRVRVDGYWGAEVVSSLKVLLKLAPSNPFPHVFPNVYRYEQWNAASVQTYIATTIATRRQEVQAAIAAQAAPPPVPDATTEASREAQAAISQSTAPLTAPPTPEAPPVQPPPDVAPPGPQPPGPSSPREPLPPAPPGSGLSPRNGAKTESTFPWLGVGLAVLVIGGIGWLAISKRKAK